MTSGGGRTYNWDSNNRLLSVQTATQTTTFTYDDQGNRVEKSGPAGTTKYFGTMVEQANGSLVKYYYASPILVAKKDTTGTYWYHADHLGSTRLMTDINGQDVKSYDYAAFGETVSETGTVENQRGFTGHMSDPDIGLIYMGARYYDATLGRFISADSIVPDPANPQAFNRYSYVYNNPISNADPTGHAPVAVAVLSAAAITAAEGGLTVIAATAWIGAGVTTVGYFTENPVLSTIGGIMLGFSGGYVMPGLAGTEGLVNGILRASVAGLTSPLSPLDPNVKEAIGWAYSAYGAFAGGGNLEPISGIEACLHSHCSNGNFLEQLEKALKVASPGTLELVKGLPDFIGKVWNLPNTAIGASIGLSGYAIDKTLYVVSFGYIDIGGKITFAHNAIQFENSPFIFGKSGLTLGNTILYGGPQIANASPIPGVYIPIWKHEMQHTFQRQILGPLYIPANLVGMTASVVGVPFIGLGPGGSPVHNRLNFMEVGPLSNPPRRWP